MTGVALTDSSGVPEPVSMQAPALRGAVMMNQDWRDLTFLHWATDPEPLQRFMPAGVRPDTFEGRSYVGLIPFRMVDAGFRRGPGVPWAGTFLETNVRLYSVDETGRRGIVFLSLDTNRSLIVAGARLGFGLPYRWARMRHTATSDDAHRYTARLHWPGARAESRIGVRVGASREATALDTFLTARWGLHVRHLGRTFYVPNAHPPWPLRHADVVELDDSLMRSVGLGDLACQPPDHVAFSAGVHTEFGLPKRVTNPGRIKRQ